METGSVDGVGLHRSVAISCIGRARGVRLTFWFIDFFRNLTTLNNDRLLVQILLRYLAPACGVMARLVGAFWGALVFASWPLMRSLTRWLNGRESLAAAILTTLGRML